MFRGVIYIYIRSSCALKTKLKPVVLCRDRASPSVLLSVPVPLCESPVLCLSP